MPAKKLGDLNELHNHHVDSVNREIYFFGEITEASASFLLKNINLLTRDNDNTVRIFLQSEGGCLHSGLALYDYISSLSNNIEIIVMGYAYSAGSVLLQAADKRICMPSSKIMIHEGEIEVFATYTSMKDCARVYEQDIKYMIDIFQEKTGQKSAILSKKMRSDVYFNAEEAIETGLVDEIWGTENS